MSREWKEVKIEEICRIRRGASPRPIHEYITESGIPWVKISDATASSSRFINKTKEFIKIEGKDKSRFITKGTLILSNSATPGIPKIMGIDACVHDGWLIIDEYKDMYYSFLYYTFNNERDKLLNLSNGSVFRNLKTDIVKNYSINIPPLEEQKAIAHILSTLDDKIETNNKINKTLEKMAQTIFKHWFVDFEFPNEDGEPYKSSAGEMIESELGMIPKGWEVVALSQLINVIDNRGKTPPQENEKTFYPIIDVKALSGDSRIIDYENCMKHVNKETYNTWFRSGHPKEGDILLSTVGSLAEMKIFYGDTGCIAQNVVALRCDDISNLYMYQYLKHIKGDLISYNIGSVQPSIKVTHIIKHKILKADIKLEERFHSLVKDLSKLIFNNHLQSSNVKELRDTLLPKLMSGEIRVPLEEGDIQ